MWLGIPKPMIPYPLLWEGAVRTVGSHLGRIPNCSEVPDTPPPHGNPGNPPPPPREPPSPAPLLDPPLQGPPPPPQGASGRQLVGGVVGVQNRGVAPPGATPHLQDLGPSVGACWRWGEEEGVENCRPDGLAISAANGGKG